MITNAVRCAPPGNKPETRRGSRLPSRSSPPASPPCRACKVIVTLGDVARRNVLRALGLKASAGAGGHGARCDGGRPTL